MTQQICNMYKTPKGFRDLYSKQADIFRYFIDYMAHVAKKYGCTEISPSIVEYTELFTHKMSDSSVVVDKEIFTLEKEGLCLRPEITASVIRFLTAHNILRSRLFYAGPCFRGERPQEGRYRQFYQFGIEMTGGNICDLYDCFNIMIEGLRLFNRKLTILINHMGDGNTRIQYEEALRQYLSDKTLSKISQVRFAEKRYLRILDSKEIEDQSIIFNAPKFYNYLSQDHKNNLQQVCSFIETQNINVKIDHNLVRGLDYYSGIVTEVIDNISGLAVCGGGEYNNLLNINNKFVNCVGFAFGIDRIVNFIDIKKNSQILLVCDDINKLQNVAYKLRCKNMHIVTYIISFENNEYKKIPSIAQQYNCNYTIILYNNDIRINGEGFNKNILYTEFENNNYQILDFIV